LIKGLAETAADRGRPPDARLLEICRRPSPAGLEAFRPYKLSMLAGLLVDAGEPGDAMGLIDDAFMLVAP
jgi:hypothetical protein